MIWARRTFGHLATPLAVLVTGAVAGTLALRGMTSLYAALALVAAVLLLRLATQSLSALTGGIFGLLLLGELLANRVFSHVVIGKPPLYVTETGMLVVGGLLLAQGRLAIPRMIRAPLAGLMTVMGIGIVLNMHRYPLISVVRDSAELYYMLFIPLGYSVFRMVRPMLDRRRLELAVLALAYVSPLFFIATRSIQIPAASEAVSASFVLFALGWDWRSVKPASVWPSVLLNLVAVTDGGARGPWVGFLAGLGVLFFYAGRVGGNGRWGETVRRRIGAFLAVVGMAGLVAFLASPPLVAHVGRDFASIIGGSQSGSSFQVANNHWRLIIWSEAFQQFWSNPLAIRAGQGWVPAVLAAMGYGGITITGYGLNTVALSNSYLQMLQWYGIWAALPFWWMVSTVIRRFLFNLAAAPVLLPVLAILSVWAINGAVEVMLEGPYMSALVWTLFGCAIAYLEERRPAYASGG